MKRRAIASIIVAAAVSIAAAGPSIGFDGEAFVKAARERDGDKASDLLEEHGPTLINSKDGKGDTALLASLARKDDTWTSFLLQKGADPNLPNRAGDTPLIVAARFGYEQGAQWLLARGAKVDQANRMGETPLIVAVQQRQVPLVRLLLARGANPDKADNAAGYSARDYAKRETRVPEMLRLINAKKAPSAATAAR